MEHEHHHQEHGNGYHDSNGQWIDTGSSFSPHHQSPVHEYNGFAFAPMPMEPMYSGAMPPPRTSHQQLQPLIMPQWPSMLTSQSTYAPPMYSAAPMQMNPSPSTNTPVSASSATSSRPASTPRRTLTDVDRRRMCQYAEEHPSTKQTEIGQMFGVERSTVSKVLRNKEKYLYVDDGNRSPVRKNKGKFPDIERALANWARNHQKQGLPLTDEMIREKAYFFAATVGNSESHTKLNGNTWLEKFKQKNNLGGSKSRKNSMAEDSEESNAASSTHTPGGISPSGPVLSPSPAISGLIKSERTGSKSPDFMEFASHGHRPFQSQSQNSLSSVFEDNAPSSFSPGAQSPTSPFFTPDSASGPSPFLGSSQSRMPTGSGSGGGNGGFQRPRSQTFPMVGIEPYVSPPSSEPLTPKFIPATSLDSPMSEMTHHLNNGSDETIHPTAATMDSMASIHANHGHMPPTTTSSMSFSASPSTLHTSSSPISPNGSSIATSPVSPSQDDARRALELLMQFFQTQPSGFVEPQEYVTMGKLMEKLKLSREMRAGSNGEMPGGMHRIPSGEFLRKSEG
ncbi:hypothetical protein K402DRAFT_342263 [Aulographum hederae CBS 113979]|uniref:HTH CENPB-type domain-containing protein n=1 Tax=Aulographum hederae CBS 113979 TaxID=1176131 RepID=A0A6G1GL86_9PEZI|nr:hypothetical protein K402DRAFT_342263 [Aulographum hederae CBS 113979]